jgi:hypothetical protein
VIAATDVPVQYFQSVITIELAVAGALLWQMRYFEHRDSLRLALALVLGATLFGSLWAIADEGPKWAAIAVTLGLSISVIPILVRVLPPRTTDAKTNERDPDFRITVAALLGYAPRCVRRSAYSISRTTSTSATMASARWVLASHHHGRPKN